MWDSITCWLTPTILFCFLNLMIGAIFIASSFSRTHIKNHQQQQQLGDDNSPQLVRTPSLLARVKSINFSGIYKFDQHYPFQPETRISEPVQDNQNEEEIEFHQQVSDSGHHVARSKSDTCEETPEPDRVPATMMKKSASERVVGREEVEEEEEKLEKLELRRPATVRERKAKLSEMASFKGDDGVDAKADDFINRFKQQLKLQRLESLKRYKEMWGRGK